MKAVALLLGFFCTSLAQASHIFDVTHPAFRFLNAPSNQENNVTKTEVKEEKEEDPLAIEYWQDKFYAAHSSGVQNLLVCTTDENLFETYMTSLIRLFISQPHVKTTFIGAESEWADRYEIYCRFRREAKPNGFVLRNLHRIETEKGDDFPNEIPKTPFNSERYSGILLSGPRKKGYAIFHRYLKAVQGIMYIPCKSYQVDSIIEQLVKDKFRRNYIMLARGMIMACSSDPSKFSTSQLYPLHPRPKQLTIPTPGYEFSLYWWFWSLFFSDKAT